VAKFQTDRQRELGDFVAKYKEMSSAAKHKTTGYYHTGQRN